MATAQPQTPVQQATVPPTAGQQPAAQNNSKQGHEVWRRMMMAGMRVLFDPKVFPQIVAMMEKRKGDPVRAAAEACAVILQKVMADMKGMDPRLAVGIVPALLAQLFELGVRGGLFKANSKMLPPAIEAVKRIVGGKPGAPQPAAAAPASAPAGGLVGSAMPPQPQPAGG